MKPPTKPSFGSRRPARKQEPGTYAPPTPMVSRSKPGKTLTKAERDAFLASRPDLDPKD